MINQGFGAAKIKKASQHSSCLGGSNYKKIKSTKTFDSLHNQRPASHRR